MTTMLDKKAFINRVIAYERTHSPNTGYMEKVARQVCGANLPNGSNLWTQYAAQFTGREETADAVHWDTPERQAPYSNQSGLRDTLDGKPDCSSFWRTMYKIFFGMEIGSYTEAQLTMLRPHIIAWVDRQVADHVLYNFKADEGRHASHAANIVLAPDPTTKVGQIGHTRSPQRPFMFDLDTYATSSRIGVFRPLTTEQRLSLIVMDHQTGLRIPNWPTLYYGVKAPAAVMEYKTDMLKIYPTCGMHATDPDYLDLAEKTTMFFQKDPTHKDELGLPLKVDGEVGAKTRYAIAVHLSSMK